ncbi:polysaccharide deacetylase family protein [Usitatibacter palustris]|uniref:polysaccharide deacetylase family protein n=1 Tax=Usitatibacter palustris TaxID=2732487 RepID=UPI001489C9E1|nr:polysaccharide deacetylase family protein [Usitatibacter palustris]
MRLALKIDVDTYRGTREGVPRLVEILKRHGAGATFFFSLGPDHSGVYGKLLPPPDIGKRCSAILRKVRDEGFEVGIRAWDSTRWRKTVGRADAVWTEQQMTLARDRFREIFAAEPEAHGAAGWQTNVHALRATQHLAFRYASDMRGTAPFVPVIRGEIVACPQIPTTLPTLEELIAGGATIENVASRALEKTSEAREHVHALRAEVEGGKLAAALDRLLTGWKEQGYQLCALRDVLGESTAVALPLATVLERPVPGRPGTLATQGPGFLEE